MNSKSIQDAIPCILPKCLVEMKPSEFCKVIILQKEQWSVLWSEEGIDTFEEEHKTLQNINKHERNLQERINSLVGKEGFNDYWVPLQDCLLKLHKFCGKIAIYFQEQVTLRATFLW